MQVVGETGCLKYSKSRGIANLFPQCLFNSIFSSRECQISSITFLHLLWPLNHSLAEYLGNAYFHAAFLSGRGLCTCQKCCSFQSIPALLIQVLEFFLRRGFSQHLVTTLLALSFEDSKSRLNVSCCVSLTMVVSNDPRGISTMIV